MDRFLRYTSGKEPVITVNLVAALIFGAVVTVTEKYGLYDWDELSLTIFGFVAVVIATWLARRGVYSPETHAAEVDEALHTPVPKE